MKTFWFAMAVWWLALAVVQVILGNWLLALADVTLAATSWYVSVLLAGRNAS